MMSPNGAPAQSFISRVEPFKSQISLALSIVQLLCGTITAINTDTNCIFAGLFQVLGAISIICLEAPMFISILDFARPISMILTEKPPWLKCAMYSAIAVIPCFFVCFSIFPFIIALICSLFNAILHGIFLIIPSSGQEQMRFQPDSPAFPISP